MKIPDLWFPFQSWQNGKSLSGKTALLLCAELYLSSGHRFGMKWLRNGSCLGVLVLTCCWGCGLALLQGLPGSGLPASVLCSRSCHAWQAAWKSPGGAAEPWECAGCRGCRVPSCPRAPLTPPCLCLSADFDRAEVGQPKAEG